jgi:hypothetical protein
MIIKDPGPSPDILFDAEDIVLIICICRLGVCNFRQLVFATGNFGGSLILRLQLLIDNGVVVLVEPKGTDVLYSATAEGLVCAYLHEVCRKTLNHINATPLLSDTDLTVCQQHCI